ncbi:DUF4230 domain-containing protein [Spirilliplanes yamanashiensis]|uniref:DUF4230 domain-containing protein n=1 Tax=Spirilliplanes yamanashiensis TaxID=42233 RepID=A0A8J4DJ52_9ACTN|nr:DUF4230 domain-containing protein [Spirilliplanes yamanashiensis]MDP9815553.1 hypothetical protein [Spirilliplanes yamanashiensis]GIJ03807.1 hypothetical protein Sya03_31590 [Spirilliplanes yamanashiensis]
MTKPGDVDDPTKEWPAYAPGRAGASAPEPADPPEDAVAPPPPGRSGPVRLLVALGLVAALIAAAVVGFRLIVPNFDNPFSSERTDRSQPVLLQSMRDLSRFVGADGTFQVIVDIEDGRENIPDFLLGRRTLFVAAGTVEAYVDFSQIGDGAVTVSDDGKTAVVKLPPPQLGKAALDTDKSYVFSEERGLLTGIGDAIARDPNQQQEVYRLGEQRITEAATQSGLAQKAQDNTRKMLEGLLRSLGYTTVTVEFAAV